VDSIDRCEDRARFSTMLDDAGIAQPKWAVAVDDEGIQSFVGSVGFPMLVRPSYVLSGAAMRVVRSADELTDCLREAHTASPDHPVVLTQFVEGAREVDVDAVMHDGVVVCIAMSEHVENAGVHSGDATLVLPTYSVTPEQANTMRHIVQVIGEELRVSGVYNTQFIIKGEWVGVIETNLRASRSIPFVSKTLATDFVGKAVRAMVGAERDVATTPCGAGCGYVGVKCAQFSFSRLPGADPALGVEMASTGEVACFGSCIEEAYMKALVASRCGIRWEKRTQRILVLDNTPIDDIAGSQQHIIVPSSAEGDNIAWEGFDMVVDLCCSRSTRALRCQAVDHSVFLVTNRQQLEMIFRSLSSCAVLHARPYSYYKNLRVKKELKLFVRQGLTESSPSTQTRIQAALDGMSSIELKNYNIILITGTQAHSGNTFKEHFETENGLPFTPSAFRQHRTALLHDADAMVVLRTGLSESTSFEIAYNILCGKNVPIFYAIDPGCEIKTTLLRDMDGYKNASVTYHTCHDGVEHLARHEAFLKFLTDVTTNE
jgi:carbamoylphosphate synthase large subunit